jgi:hypothetical protein
VNKTLPIRVWTEPIDNGALAVIAQCYVVHHGYVRGFSAWLIAVGANRWAARELGEQHFLKELRTTHGGFLPHICHVTEWPYPSI